LLEKIVATQTEIDDIRQKGVTKLNQKKVAERIEKKEKYIQHVVGQLVELFKKEAERRKSTLDLGFLLEQPFSILL
jgi:hypothetical protein